MNEEIRLALLQNLVARMDYNEKSKTWSLKGNITADEFQSVQDAIMTYERFVVKLVHVE